MNLDKKPQLNGRYLQIKNRTKMTLIVRIIANNLFVIVCLICVIIVP